jgi:hypothetical protein
MLDGGVDLHALHVESAVAREHDAALAGCEGRARCRAERVTHSRHAHREKPMASTWRTQVMDGVGAGVAGIDEHHARLGSRAIDGSKDRRGAQR